MLRTRIRARAKVEQFIVLNEATGHWNNDVFLPFHMEPSTAIQTPRENRANTQR